MRQTPTWGRDRSACVPLPRAPGLAWLGDERELRQCCLAASRNKVHDLSNLAGLHFLRDSGSFLVIMKENQVPYRKFGEYRKISKKRSLQKLQGQTINVLASLGS